MERGLSRLFSLLSMSLGLFVFSTFVQISSAYAYINQVDGTVVPLSDRMQQCLDRPGTGEAVPGAVDAVVDAEVVPEAYRPVFNAMSGHYRVVFSDLAEGAGFRNSFGWYWIGEDVTDPANLHTIFGCRTYGTCACPCATTREVTVDFDTEAGFAPGRPIGFWLRTPERLNASRENGAYNSSAPYCSPNVGCDPTIANLNDSCGGRLDTNNRIYFTSQALNDDGDFVHFLVYESVTHANGYYFGFEDLFRGGDNDFEDMLTRASGLVPLCDPQPETCDNQDQDCDGAIDEGLVRDCATACGAGQEVCAAGVYQACSARQPELSESACDNLDEDCDGRIDEGLTRACMNACGVGEEVCQAGSFLGCSAREPSSEVCDGIDNDCDGRVDEALSRACSTQCGGGTEECVGGVYQACSAAVPVAETCNNSDDDCDGRVDENISAACFSDCGDGAAICVAGEFVNCSAPVASSEICNNIDDDCDGNVDENVTRGCASACGVGSERCEAGVFLGCDAPLPSEEVCNNLDDDCDGVIDDGNPGGGAACVPTNGGEFLSPPPATENEMCVAGVLRCIAGEQQCFGATGAAPEVCNCQDDDCDGEIDEGTNDMLCGENAACIDCECASPCVDTEFPCPAQLLCDRTMAEPEAGIIGYCVKGRCKDVTCEAGEVCEPLTGECYDPCADVQCSDGKFCTNGRCVENNCYGTGCPDGQVCRSGACAEPPCAGVTCADGEYCAEGACVALCEVDCPEGMRCDGRTCVEAECQPGCAEGERCIEGECRSSACPSFCGNDRVCHGNTCVDDPCRFIECPEQSRCDSVVGICRRVDAPSFEAAEYRVISGSGCACRSVDASASWFWSFLMLAWLLCRRRLSFRSVVSAGKKLKAGFIVIGCVSVLGGGCNADPFCIDGCGEVLPDSGVADGGEPDAMNGDGRVDGCVPTGEELCNELDDDCDGRTDEGFDLQNDLANCGSCGAECALPGAFPACREGVCEIESCAAGAHDLDGMKNNGCEYACVNSGAEACDRVDNDCDGAIDETFNLQTDRENCGTCGSFCSLANADADCVAGACQQVACRPGFIDLNGDSSGCEYQCVNSGDETCDGVDNDCDGSFDEGFDLNTDVVNCGGCGRSCFFLNASPGCAAGVCTLGVCNAGYHDLDGDARTGCEYRCTPSGAERCDGIDNDCDGATDESDPALGNLCGSIQGACTQGRYICQFGALVCAGGVQPQAELCNAVDDDCDGATDEHSALEPIAGVGDRCGGSNIGECAFGTTACVAGALQCAGGFRGPSLEVCNGLDDDCNGASDDGLAVPAPATVPTCANQIGVCAGRIPSCRGAGGWACDDAPNYQVTETLCDGLDNDCDGLQDEGCLSFADPNDQRIDSDTAASSTNSLSPNVDLRGNDISVAWMEVQGEARAKMRVWSSATGWSSENRLDDGAGAAIRPQVALGNLNRMISAWADFRGGNIRGIFGRAGANAGRSLDAADIQVNATGATSTTDSFSVDLAVDGSTAHVVFESFVSGRSRHIFYSRSSDGGLTFSEPVQITASVDPNYVAATPRVAADSGRVYILWRDNRSGALDIYLRASMNDGASFSGEKRIDVGDAAGSHASFSPRIAANGANVSVVWVDDRNAGAFDIYQNTSADFGATFLPSAVSLDADAFPHNSLDPKVVILNSGRRVALWVDYRSGLADILASESADGVVWSAPVRVDTGSAPGVTGSYDVDLASDGVRVAAIWSDDRAGALDIYVNYSLDGVTWQPSDYRFDSDIPGSADSHSPQVAIGTSGVHGVWIDNRAGVGCPSPVSGSCANGDVFHRRLAP